MAQVLARIPTLDLDLFGEASLKDPFADYRALRDAGALVRLPRLGLYAIGRYAEVQAALRDDARLISGEGVGFSDTFNALRGNNVLQSDGDLHKRMRATVMRPLTPAALKQARADLKALVAERLRALAGRGEFEAMAALASFLPVQAISHLVGLPEAGRERMLEWAGAVFNTIGPRQDSADLSRLGELMPFMASLGPEAVREGSWAAQLFGAVGTGKLSIPEAMGAISAYIVPSLDTTILAKGHLLHNLARHPEQWALLRERPELIPAAVLEGVRHSSVLRWFSRVAVEDYPVGEAVLPKGARVMLLYGCANRDERHYADPDRFDVTRDARDHLAWGTGPHMCAGMNLARIEMEVMLEALVEADVGLKSGEPQVGTNAGLYGFTALPYELTAG